MFGDISRMHQKQITIHAGEEDLAETGRVLYVQADWTTDDLLQAAGRRLELVSTPKRMFNCNGELYTKLELKSRTYSCTVVILPPYISCKLIGRSALAGCVALYVSVAHVRYYVKDKAGRYLRWAVPQGQHKNFVRAGSMFIRSASTETVYAWRPYTCLPSRGTT